MGLSPRLRKLLFGVDITEPLVERCDDCWQVHNIRDVCPIPDVKIRAPKAKEAARMDPDKALAELRDLLDQLDDHLRAEYVRNELIDEAKAKLDDVIEWRRTGGF